MKITAINSSQREQGNTEIIINKVLGSAKNEDIDTEIISLANKTIQPCKGCFLCSGKGKCVAIDAKCSRFL